MSKMLILADVNSTVGLVGYTYHHATYMPLHNTETIPMPIYVGGGG